jgi:hypothetical protein
MKIEIVFLTSTNLEARFGTLILAYLDSGKTIRRIEDLKMAETYDSV